MLNKTDVKIVKELLDEKNDTLKNRLDELNSRKKSFNDDQRHLLKTLVNKNFFNTKTEEKALKRSINKIERILIKIEKWELKNGN